MFYRREPLFTIPSPGRQPSAAGFLSAGELPEPHSSGSAVVQIQRSSGILALKGAAFGAGAGVLRREAPARRPDSDAGADAGATMTAGRAQGYVTGSEGGVRALWLLDPFRLQLPEQVAGAGPWFRGNKGRDLEPAPGALDHLAQAGNLVALQVGSDLFLKQTHDHLDIVEGMVHLGLRDAEGLEHRDEPVAVQPGHNVADEIEHAETRPEGIGYSQAPEGGHENPVPVECEVVRRQGNIAREQPEPLKGLERGASQPPEAGAGIPVDSHRIGLQGDIEVDEGMEGFSLRLPPLHGLGCDLDRVYRVVEPGGLGIDDHPPERTRIVLVSCRSQPSPPLIRVSP